MKCKKCGGTEWRTLNSMTKRNGWVTRRVCVQCEKVRGNERYARLTDEQRVKRLEYKRDRARASGVRSAVSVYIERTAMRIRRDALRAMLHEWRKATHLPIGAGIIAIARAESDSTGERYDAVLWRTRYQRDPKFKAREIERLHRKKLMTHSRREFMSDGTLHSKAVQALFAAARGCTYCGKRFESGRDKTLDHVVPLSKGGMHSILNVVIACRACNTRKGGQVWLAA